MTFSELSIGIASDHAGLKLKTQLILFLEDLGVTVTDYGTHSEDSCDYPDLGHMLAGAVAKGKHQLGIAICFSGNGICMTCNKHKGIRAALCWDTPLAELARTHNGANILALPANFVSTPQALDIVRTFITTEPEGGRHERRRKKIELC